MTVRLATFLTLTSLCGAAVAALGGPTATQEQQQPPAGPTATPEQQQPSDTRLVPADELVGLAVVTREGERVGTLAYITVDLDEGKISHLVVDTSGSEIDSTPTASSTSAPSAATPANPSSAQSATNPPAAAGQSEEDLMIVPWDIAALEAGRDEVTIAATGHHIANAPRLARQELNRLAEPSVATYVVDYWAPVSELAAMESERDQRAGPTKQQTAPSRDQSEQSPTPSPDIRAPQSSTSPDIPDTASQAATTAGVGPTNSGGRTTTGSGTAGTADIGTSGSSTASTTAGGSSTASTRGDERQKAVKGLQSGTTGNTRNRDDAPPMVLFGQEVVTSVAPPMFQLGQDLEGSRVVGQNGQPIGEVGRIMIDADTGDAAFAVIEGTSGGSVPVPLQTLEWSTEGTTLLGADASALQPDAALTDPSGSVSRHELAQLYERFDVQPYWERSQRSTSTGGFQNPTTESPQ